MDFLPYKQTYYSYSIIEIVWPVIYPDICMNRIFPGSFRTYYPACYFIGFYRIISICITISSRDETGNAVFNNYFSKTVDHKSVFSPCGNYLSRNRYSFQMYWFDEDQ